MTTALVLVVALAVVLAVVVLDASDLTRSVDSMRFIREETPMEHLE